MRLTAGASAEDIIMGLVKPLVIGASGPQYALVQLCGDNVSCRSPRGHGGVVNSHRRFIATSRSHCVYRSSNSLRQKPPDAPQ